MLYKDTDYACRLASLQVRAIPSSCCTNVAWRFLAQQEKMLSFYTYKSNVLAIAMIFFLDVLSNLWWMSMIAWVRLNIEFK